jgi:hypothetical protein
LIFVLIVILLLEGNLCSVQEVIFKNRGAVIDLIIWVIKSGRQMGRTCGTYGGEERYIQGFSGET